MTREITPVTGAYTTNGRPNGVTSLTPHLAVPSAKEALAFYRDVFGATVGEVTEMGGTGSSSTPSSGSTPAASSWVKRSRATGWSRRPPNAVRATH